MMLDLDKYNGIIFDNDGVLVDSEYLSCYALNILFENFFGIDIGKDYSNVLGTSDKYAIEYYLTKHSIIEYDIENMVLEKSKIYFQIARDKLKTFGINSRKLAASMFDKTTLTKKISLILE